jgi:hypothetical protein
MNEIIEVLKVAKEIGNVPLVVVVLAGYVVKLLFTDPIRRELRVLEKSIEKLSEATKSSISKIEEMCLRAVIGGLGGKKGD